MLGKIKRKWHRVVAQRNLQRRIALEQEREEQLNMQNVPPSLRSPLTLSEQDEVRHIWSGLNPRVSMQEYEVFKAVNGFNPSYLSHHTYLPLLAHRINNYRYTKLFEHKSLCGYLTDSPIHFPESFIRCIDGELYGGDMRQLGIDEALAVCASHDCLIFKEAAETSGGKGVVRLAMANMAGTERAAEVQRMLADNSRDFVIQECIIQHPSTARFNQTSVNTFRITSLYLNGEFSVLSVIFRFGKRGMSVDNWGAGGIIVGVGLDGTMHPRGYDIQMKPFTGYNGTTFEGYVFPELPAILDQVRDAHMHAFPLCKLIGWDVCLDSNGKPAVLELNSSQPGIFGEQLCTGPIFGDRTAEVIEYCQAKDFRY